MNPIIALILTVLISGTNTFRDPDTCITYRIDPTLNTLLVTGGLYYFGYTGSIKYERLLYDRVERGKTNPLFFRIGLLKYTRLAAFSQPLVTGEVGMILGHGPSYFEPSLGLGYWPGGDHRLFVLVPVGSVGYRRQKEDSRFVFRAGLGWPEVIYASVGVVF